jgi:choline/glycine/proline betaine transport protein
MSQNATPPASIEDADARTQQPPAGKNTPAADAGPEATTRVNKAVFFGSAFGVLAIALWAIVAKDNAEAVIGSMVGWVSTNMG